MKRLLALGLVLCMLMSALADCSPGGGNDSSQSTKTAGSSKNDDGKNGVSSEAGDTGATDGALASNGGNGSTAVTYEKNTGLPLAVGYPKDGGEISVWTVWSSNFLESLDEVAAVQELEKQTGIKVDWTSVDRGERNEKFGILISSGDLPDLIYAQASEYPGGVAQAVEDGVFMDITEFVDKFVPNYKALIESNEQIKKDVTSDDGRLLCFYQINCGENGVEAEKEFLGLCVRKDWLDDLNMDAPVTIDDWYAMLKAFKEEKGAEAPLMIGPKGTMITGAFTSAFGVMPEFYQENGTVKFGPIEAGYKDFVETFRQWYAEGLIDQNFMTNNVERFPAHEYTTTGMTGAFTHAYSMVGHGMQDQGLVDDETFELMAVKNPVLKAGDTSYALPLSTGIITEPMYVSADCKDLEALGAWMNYNYSYEGMMTQTYGVEGVHYMVDDKGKVTLTDEILNNPEYTPNDARSNVSANLRFGLANWYGGMLVNGEEKLNEYLATEDIWTSQDMSKYLTSKITMTADETETFTSNYSDIQTFVDEKVAKYIMGTESMDTWDAFVEQLHTMGIDACIASKQAALDRYNQR